MPNKVDFFLFHTCLQHTQQRAKTPLTLCQWVFDERMVNSYLKVTNLARNVKLCKNINSLMNQNQNSNKNCFYMHVISIIIPLNPD